MTIYAALLRGINVGAKHRMGMSDLAQALRDAGFSNVRTYIQSGNVLFESDGEEAELRERMERTIERRFGFPVPVIMRTSTELHAILDHCPFTADEVQRAEEISGVESLHVSMLPSPLQPEAVEKLKSFPLGGDRYTICGRDIYLLLQGGVHTSKLVMQILKAAASVTMRNFKTMCQLAQMADEMEK